MEMPLKGGKDQDDSLLPGLSLDSLEDTVVSRRAFLRLLLASSGALLVAALPFARRFIGHRTTQFPRVQVGHTGDLPRGAAKAFAYPGKDNPALLVHLPNDQWHAYGGVCTHLSCLVRWDARSGDIDCPCHRGRFAADTGAVLAGPPRRALEHIELSIEGDRIFAVRRDG